MKLLNLFLIDPYFYTLYVKYFKSDELEELLTKHSNQIDTEHIDLFLEFINELRICNYVNQ